MYESGRQSLSGFNIPVESLCRVASVQYGSIQLVEEEGYDQSAMMMASKQQQSSKQENDEESLT